jgi:hypothetical protein
MNTNLLFEKTLLRSTIVFLFFFFSVFGQGSEKGPRTSVDEIRSIPYNYDVFHGGGLDWGRGNWFKKGEKFPNKKVFSIDRKKTVSIADLVKNKPIVIEVGSITCPAYYVNQKSIANLMKKYGDQIDFYTLYARENHPREKFPSHKKMDQKVSFAKKAKELDKIESSILVDDVAGSLHDWLGRFPNAVYLIGKDRVVSHWAVFTHMKHLEKGIQDIIAVSGIGRSAPFSFGGGIYPLMRLSDEEKIKIWKKVYGRAGEKVTANSNFQPSKDEMKKYKAGYTKNFRTYMKYIKSFNPTLHDEIRAESKTLKEKNNP